MQVKFEGCGMEQRILQFLFFAYNNYNNYIINNKSDKNKI
jgi:hypothetical protein